MTDLTKQWEKGELSGLYWCKITISPYIEMVSVESIDKDYMIKVLAKVPSYDEWIVTKSAAESCHDLQEKNVELLHECQELKKENAHLRKELSEHKEICCCFDNEVLRLENAKLKEQLEVAIKIFNRIIDLTENVEPYEDMSNLIMCKELAEQALIQIKQTEESEE